MSTLYYIIHTRLDTKRTSARALVIMTGAIYYVFQEPRLIIVLKYYTAAVAHHRAISLRRALNRRVLVYSFEAVPITYARVYVIQTYQLLQYAVE